MKKVSLNDLAKALNLSKTLVSFVMNGKGDAYGINPETQKKVQAMAKKMNYRPNLIARGLRTGKSNLLGLIVSDIGNPFYSRISRAVEAEAEKHGYYMMVCSTDENETREKRLVQMLLEEQGVNGLIISTSQHDPEYFRELKKSGYPLVLIDRSINGLKIDYVGVDNYKGGFEATMQLLNVGYKKIAMLRISPSFLSTINDRARGYMDALKERGIKPDPKLIREIPFDDIREKVFTAVRELIAPPNSVQAIFLLNNSLTSYALECIQEAGLRIPQDIALISFDDTDFFRFSNPPVTAVEQPLEKIGHEAVRLLLTQIEAGEVKPKPCEAILPTHLIIRKSCGSFLVKQS